MSIYIRPETTEVITENYKVLDNRITLLQSSVSFLTNTINVVGNDITLNKALTVSGNITTANNISCNTITASTFSASTFNITTLTATTLNATGNITTNGNITVGPNGGTTERGIYIRGTYGDAMSDNYSGLVRRIYQTGTEKSELVMWCFNDIDGESGPDRVRTIGSNIRFDTYDTALPVSNPSLEDVNIKQRMLIKSTGDVDIEEILTVKKTTNVLGNLNVGNFTQFGKGVSIQDGYLTIINREASSNNILDLIGLNTTGNQTTTIRLGNSTATSANFKYYPTLSGDYYVGFSANNSTSDILGYNSTKIDLNKNTTINGSLNFPQTLIRNKISLYPSASADSYYGLGVTNDTMLFTIDKVGSKFQFDAYKSGTGVDAVYDNVATLEGNGRLYLGVNNGGGPSGLYIRGTTGDSGNTASGLVRRIYAPTEKSELLLWNFGEADTTNGPDLIRYLSNSHRFDTNISGQTDISLGTQRMIIKSDGNIDIEENLLVKKNLTVNGTITGTINGNISGTYKPTVRTILAANAQLTTSDTMIILMETSSCILPSSTEGHIIDIYSLSTTTGGTVSITSGNNIRLVKTGNMVSSFVIPINTTVRLICSGGAAWTQLF